MGDVNLDGHMDFLVNAQKKGSDNDESYSLLFMNTDCPDNLITQVKSVEGFSVKNCRYFTTTPPNDIVFTKITAPASYLSAFFDWGELG